jgi:flagellar biosynthesis protein FlhB
VYFEYFGGFLLNKEREKMITKITPKNLWQNWKRSIQFYLLNHVTQLVKSIHKIVFFFYLAIVSFVVLTAGVFMIVVRSISQYQNSGHLYFDPINVAGLAIVIVFSIFSIWLLKERRWIEALHLDQVSNPDSKN